MSNITRQYNEFQDLATTNVDFALIHAKYKKIKEAFESLSAVHMTLVSELQPEKIEPEKTTYTEAKNKYEEAMRQHRNLKEQHRLQGEVVPEDSVSQVASHTSKASEASSARAKAAAKKAALLVQARYLKQMNEIELQRLDIEQHLRGMQQRADLERRRAMAERQQREAEAEGEAELKHLDHVQISQVVNKIYYYYYCNWI